MAVKTKSTYPLAETVINDAAACCNDWLCLEQGPSCRVGAVLNRDVMIVDCRDRNDDCPYYLAQSSTAAADSRGLCNCPVRLALWEKYGL